MAIRAPGIVRKSEIRKKTETGISKHGRFLSWKGLITILMLFMMMLSTSRNSLEKSLMSLMRLSESNTSVQQLFLMIMIIIIIMVMVMVMVLMKLMMTLMMMSERSNSVRLMYRAAVSRLLLLVNHPPGAARWK